jgi:hypothetical protein
MIDTRFALTAVLALATATGALAQGAARPTLVATFSDWTMWTFDGDFAGTGEGKVCYIYSEPETMEPARLDHGRVSFAVTTSPAQGIDQEANFIAGYPLQDQSSVTVEIGDRTFTMFTQGDSAWLVNKADEVELLDAMRAGSTMIVRATSRRGNSTVYNYSLSGVTAATNRMQSECQ